MSVKTDRINSMLVKEISYILEVEVKNKEICFVTVTDCQVTNDLSYAKVYVTILKDEMRKTTLDALNKAASFIRSALYDRVDMRHIPILTFVYDESIGYAHKIESIIDQINMSEK